MKVGIIGAGRIGKVHAKNISMFVPEMEIKTIADPFMNEQTGGFCQVLRHSEHHQGRKRHSERSEIDAVLICSSTDTIQVHHRGLLTQAKNIFCEADRL